MGHGTLSNHIHSRVCSIQAINTVSADNTLLANKLNGVCLIVQALSIGVELGERLEESNLFNTPLSDLIEPIHNICFGTYRKSLN